MRSALKEQVTRLLKTVRQSFAPLALLNLLRRHKKVVFIAIFFLLITTSFLWPMVRHVGTYSEGGDHMFNAWTLARNHHCLLGEGCQKYSDANIFFPHQDSFLYSETQFSAGLLTLPLHFINPNPLFAANIWYVLSAFFSGFFMYLLARYLSKNNEPISILAGLIFEFGPTKITAMSHLQSLSIFYLPLIILLLLKYKDTGNKKYLFFFAVTCSLLFLASWYQMAFGLVVIALFIPFVLINHKQRGLFLAAATALAILTTLPIAQEYMRFSKATNAAFSVGSQIGFASGPYDYFMPEEHTPAGSLYYKLRPYIQRNAYNSDNYSYAGVTLYAILLLSLAGLLRKKNRTKDYRVHKQTVIVLATIFMAGLLISFGPIVKLGARYVFKVESFNVIIPAPYILVDKLLPQLSFIRAVGRASVICLFALCCLLALYSQRLDKIRSNVKRYSVLSLIILLISLDLLPLQKLVTTPFQPIEQHRTSFTVPGVYTFIRENPSINNLVTIRTYKDYSYAGIPIAPVEDVLWSGYHNRNIFNGYSGYQPPDYETLLADFNDLQVDDVEQMKVQGLRFVLVDKLLSDPNSSLVHRATEFFSENIYEDNRYALFRI